MCSASLDGSSGVARLAPQIARPYLALAPQGKRQRAGALVAAAQRGGFQRFATRERYFGGIEAQNRASIRLHESLGFVQTGHMPEVGQKFGRWLDLCLMQLRLDDRPSPGAES